MSDEEKSAEVKLAEAVAERTANRMREDLRVELELRDATLRRLWTQDMGQLRDDLTVKGMLSELKSMPDTTVDSRAIRVLVVDDYHDIRRAFVQAFTKAGMEVLQASSGASAAEILEADHVIEVVVTDISMPKNGYTLLEHVRLKYPAIEVIMTSGYETEVDKARKHGAFGFLPKPFSLGQAVMLVERAAEFRRMKLATSSRG